MHVTFGLSLDARQGPSTRDYFNAPVVGRMGLLSLLETYLGLSAPELHSANRVAAYLGLLQQLNDGKRFYSQSLKIDSVGTAARLLSWRDEWRMGGWAGQAEATSPRRIVELAAVEGASMGRLAPGEAERLAAVAAALAAGEPKPIQSVALLEDLPEYPWAWQQVLRQLPNVTTLPLAPQGQGQLRRLQERALRAAAYGQFDLEGPDAAGPVTVTDESVQLVRTQSWQVAETWLSVNNATSPADRLVVAEDCGDSVDSTLAATGGANCGFENHSQLRPALQALGLAVELCWEPVDVPRLVDFLTHPVGPFSRSARNRLASAVAEQPGIGGEEWKSVKADVVAGKDGKELGEEIEFWLESPRWSREIGVPIPDLRVRVEKLTAAISKRLTGSPADAAVLPAYQQCSAVSDSLAQMQRQGVSNVLPRELEQLVAQATSAGAINPAAAAQVGCMRSARAAGACIDAADEVIWWMPASPKLPRHLPWSDAELKELTRLGVVLRNPAKELLLLALNWLRPLLAARSRFVLVLPPPGAEDHPMLQLLLQLSPGLKDSALVLDTALRASFQGSLCEMVATVPFADVPRLIQLPGPIAVPAHDPHSYTSLNELFNSPALFALKRIGHLHPTRILAAEEDNRLLGTLAHRVFERLFEDPAALTWSNAQALTWFRAHVDELLRTEGAVLLMQGAGVSEQRFRAACEHAIAALLDQLRAAGVTSVKTEVEFNGHLGTIALTGKVDLLLELPGSRRVALDMKWHGDKRYSEALSEGKHLQLALYSTLIEQNLGTAPVALGYFILDSASLYISEPNVLPLAHVRQPKQGRSVAALLKMAQDTWQWRVGQLNTGVIEVVPVKPSDEYQGPPGTLEVEGPMSWDQDRLVLLGAWQ